MNWADIFTVHTVVHGLVSGAPVLFAYWLGRSWGRSHPAPLPATKPWQWERQPPSWKFGLSRSGHRLPEPPPMPAVRLMQYDLDQAALALSLYVWAPSQVEVALLLANHHLKNVQLMLDKFDENIKPESENEPETSNAATGRPPAAAPASAAATAIP